MRARRQGAEPRGAPDTPAAGGPTVSPPRSRGRGGAAAAGEAALPGGGQAEEYVVGQVAGSLRADGAAAAPLARLFSAAAAPPVLVAVRGGNKKRKQTEEAEEVSEYQSSSVTQEPPVKAKKARKKELSKAEKKLANRESALERADDEEEQKLFQNKKKPKKKASHAITKTVDSDTGTTVKQQKKKKVADETVNRRTVFVGNLPVNCTVQAVKSLFKEYGQIQSIRFRSLIPAEDTSSKKLAAIKHKVHPNAKFINAYVVFKEECDAVKALKANGTEIASGFHIRVDIASKSSSHDNKRSVFLGNLSYDISDDAVREHFSVCGGVVAVRIVRDRNTGLGKGFGYVLFENTDAVHLALKLNETVLMGRRIRVKRCGEKWKAPPKSSSRAPKDRADTTLKTKRRSTDSFVGEKATPLKKRGKPKRPKTVPRNKAGKKKGSSDKNPMYRNVNYSYKG
ncbi:RNA-binding protein 34 [Falco biarmicus]|uniref:RNA-binding protein 34 n=1 Tax=Falco cherrug TaxID=345164 RepID=UPI00247B2771|nr:RNA-binding protein 34 [Falco cherrug]XP_055666656.1 RNA-binding protein 34 [Falco peregrinus]XP_056199809.1 RNA-binding protein 34 [Falco biarmicus]